MRKTIIKSENPLYFPASVSARSSLEPQRAALESCLQDARFVYCLRAAPLSCDNSAQLSKLYLQKNPQHLPFSFTLEGKREMVRCSVRLESNLKPLGERGPVQPRGHCLTQLSVKMLKNVTPEDISSPQAYLDLTGVDGLLASG